MRRLLNAEHGCIYQNSSALQGRRSCKMTYAPNTIGVRMYAHVLEWTGMLGFNASIDGQDDDWDRDQTAIIASTHE